MPSSAASGRVLATGEDRPVRPRCPGRRDAGVRLDDVEARGLQFVLERLDRPAPGRRRRRGRTPRPTGPTKNPTRSVPPGRRTRANSSSGTPDRTPGRGGSASTRRARRRRVRPASSRASMLPTVERDRPGTGARAWSMNAGTGVDPAHVAPTLGEEPVQCPGPHPASRSGPSTDAAHEPTSCTSDGCTDAIVPRCSTYSAARSAYAASTLVPIGAGYRRGPTDTRGPLCARLGACEPTADPRTVPVLRRSRRPGERRLRVRAGAAAHPGHDRARPGPRRRAVPAVERPSGAAGR